MAAEDGLKAQKLLAQSVWMQNTLFFQGVLDVTYDTPPLILWLFAISDDFLSFCLFAVKAEYLVDETCILKIHDMWRHHFERFQLFVVEREYLHDADHLGAGIIAAEACHFYQVELVVVEACFLYLII